jgi:glycine cleavage system H protein
MHNDLLYTRRDLWISKNQPHRLGLTEFCYLSRSAVTNVHFFVQLKFVKVRDLLCEVGSETATGEVVAPFGCEIIGVNSRLLQNPSLVSTDPYGEGWLFELARMEWPSMLLTLDQYWDYLKLVERSREVLRNEDAQPHDLIGLMVDGCEIVSILGWGEEQIVYSLRDLETGDRADRVLKRVRPDRVLKWRR